MRRFLTHLAIIATIAVMASAAVVFFSGGAVALFAVAAVAAVAVAVAGITAIRRASSKCNLILEAVRNNDFSLQFHDNDRALNGMLSDLAGIVKDMKIQAKQAEQYYRLIINQVNAGIFTLDEKGNVRLCNNCALDFFGFSTFNNIVQLDRIDPDLKFRFLGMSPGDALPLSFRNKEKSVSVSAGMSIIEMKDGCLRIYVMNDIHSALDRKELEAWSQLTRVLTHEIMNSVAPIRALSDNLLGELNSSDSRTKEKIEVIRDTSADLMAFTESYRKFSSIPKPEKRLVYVKELLSVATELMETKLKDVRLTVAVNPDDLIVNIDKVLMGRVVVNLLSNAAEAGASHVSIKASCNENDIVTIDVSDDGAKIPDECRSQIFIPFFTTKPSGSGIGLAVSRRIVDLHNGNISLIQPVRPPFTKTFRLSLR